MKAYHVNLADNSKTLDTVFMPSSFEVANLIQYGDKVKKIEFVELNEDEYEGRLKDVINNNFLDYNVGEEDLAIRAIENIDDLDTKEYKKYLALCSVIKQHNGTLPSVHDIADYNKFRTKYLDNYVLFDDDVNGVRSLLVRMCGEEYWNGVKNGCYQTKYGTIIQTKEIFLNK